MSAYSLYAARTELNATRVRHTPAAMLTTAANARRGEELDGYPISGDALTVNNHGKPKQAERRRRRALTIERKTTP